MVNFVLDVIFENLYGFPCVHVLSASIVSPSLFLCLFCITESQISFHMNLFFDLVCFQNCLKNTPVRF